MVCIIKINMLNIVYLSLYLVYNCHFNKRPNRYGWVFCSTCHGIELEVDPTRKREGGHGAINVNRGA